MRDQRDAAQSRRKRRRGVLDIGQRDRRAANQLLADLVGVIRAAIVDQHDFQPTLGAKL